MAPDWLRSRFTLGIVVAIAVAGVSTSAHRRDEYLQAVRIDIGPDRVQLELDLTPGIAVASGVIAGIDRDLNGSVSAEEINAYAARVLGDIRVAVDDEPLALGLSSATAPAVDAMRNGEGTIRLQLSAAVVDLGSGTHHLAFHNAHRADIGVYLANALVPRSNRVDVLAQRRDVDQRELIIDYGLRGAATTPWWTVLLLVAGIAMAAVILWRLRPA